MNKKEVREFVKTFHKEIATYAINAGKTKAARHFGVSTGAVDTALYRAGYSEMCSNWYLKTKNKSTRSVGRPRKQVDTNKPLLIIMDELSDDNGTNKILDALGMLFDERKKYFTLLNAKNEEIIRLKTELNHAKSKIFNLESEIHKIKRVNTANLIERARSAMVTFGD